MRSPAGEKAWCPTCTNLTQKDQVCLFLVANGYMNTEIAQIMWVSRDAISSRIANLLRKLDARNREHLTAKAIRLGVIPANLVEPRKKTPETPRGTPVQAIRLRPRRSRIGDTDAGT